MSIVIDNTMSKLLWWLSLELIFHRDFCASDIRPLKYSVDEESSKDTYIGNIISDTDIKMNLVLTLHSADGKADRLLRLDSKTGSLFTATAIDRESICTKQDRHCYLEAAVQVSLGKWINIIVEILDINDHRPTFVKSRYQFLLSEKVDVGYSLRLELAYDADCDNNARISYKLEVHSLWFSLLDGQERGLSLNVMSPLDFENETMRRTALRLIACDFGVPKLCGSTEVVILLQDVNDNEPRFNKSVYESILLETVPVNAVVFKFSASDLDFGNNGMVKYSITDSGDLVAKHHFIIDELGQLRVIRSLESLNVEEIKVKVLAEDLGSPSLRATCLLRLKIIDVNNHKPEIKITFVNGTTIIENQPPGNLVALVSVIDRDTGNNGNTVCDVKTSGNIFVLKHENRIKNNDFYNLVLARIVDKEVDIMVHVSILCKDHGSPPLLSQRNFTVDIGDVNEHAPVIRNGNFEVDIPEDVEVSTTIYKFLVTDGDYHSNLTFKFRDESSFFYINPMSGSVIIKSRLDREEIDIFRLHCIVVDNYGGVLFSTSTMVTVTLSDVNDNYPKLLSPKSFQVPENSPKESTMLGKLTAQDNDIGENGTVRFEIVRVVTENDITLKQSMVGNIFKIDPNKGQIFVMSSLDREECSKYKVTIRVSDLGSTPLFVEEDVDIVIMDENDNRPIFEQPFSQWNISLPVDINTPVLLVRATDKDSARNSNLTYVLLSGSQFFKLNPQTGQLYPSATVKSGSFELTIQACDNGYPPAYSEVCHVQVLVSPSSFMSSYDMTIEEKNRIDSLLMIIISSSTCIVFLCLLAAIVIVKWHRNPRKSTNTNKPTDPGVCHSEEDNDSTIQKWKQNQQNQYTLSIGNQYYRPVSVTTQEPLITNEKCDSNNACSVFHFRYPFTKEIEMSSADSGKGTMEDDCVPQDCKGKYSNSTCNYVAVINPYQSSLDPRYPISIFPDITTTHCETLRLLDAINLLDSDIHKPINSISQQPEHIVTNIALNSFLSI